MSEELQAGKELDALIAERVMGWRPHVRNTAHWTDADAVDRTDYRVRGGVGEWSPSKNITDAWEVVEKFPAIVIQRATSRDGSAVGYMCSLPLEPNDSRRAGQRITSLNAEADTAPLAICRAALQAISEAVSPPSR